MGNGKVAVFSVLAFSTAAILYWLYQNKKKKGCVVGEIRNGVVVLSSEQEPEDIQSLPGDCISERGIRVLVERLRNGVENGQELESILLSLLKTTAFESKKVFFLACNGVSATANYLEVNDARIKGLVLQIMNNMALHKESQEIIKMYIPQISYIIGHESRDGVFEGVLVKSLQVLTNLSVFDENHEEIIKEMNPRWLMLMQSTSMTIKIQTLKLLVNLSINKSNTDVLYKPELLQQVSYFITPDAHPDLCLRSTTYLANVLSAAQRQQNTTLKYFMVSVPGIEENIRQLSRSENEDIRFQANRALAFMS